MRTAAVASMQPSPPRAVPSLVHAPRSGRTGIEGARNLRRGEPLFEPSNPPSSRASRVGAGVEPRRSRDSEHRKLHASPERANRAVYCYRSVCRHCRESRQKIHRFFESLTSFLEPIQGREEVESDNFRFIVHELFISLIAVLLRYERFEFAAHMMSTPYLRKRPNASPTVETFECFRNYLRALQTRNGDWSYDDFPYIPICLSNGVRGRRLPTRISIKQTSRCSFDPASMS